MMLATRGRTEDIARLTKAGWLFDLKIDGVRAEATVVDGDVTLVSRQGVTITAQYPEVVEALTKALPRGHWVLDGEIAVNDERGLPSWPRTHKRNAQTRNAAGWAQSHPATLYVFDLLVASGTDMRTWSFANRRQVLDQEIHRTTHVRPVLTSSDGAAMWSVVTEHGLEGLVAKRPGAAYTDSRSTSWIKIKRTSTATCLVGGHSAGTGSRGATFGNLHLYLVREGELVLVGHVGSGFSHREVKEAMRRLHQPPMIVEVEYLDFHSGSLRQPVFKRFRADAGVGECSYDQVEGS